MHRSAMLVLLTLLVLVRTADAAKLRHGRVDFIPDRAGYVETANVGLDTSREVIDYADLPGYNKQAGALVVCVENENTTAANVLLVKLYPVGYDMSSVPAAALTTPTDATATDVVPIPGGLGAPVCFNDGGYAGHVWQSEGPTTVDANARTMH